MREHVTLNWDLLGDIYTQLKEEIFQLILKPMDNQDS